MIYANLLEITNDGILYEYGGDCKDFSGRLLISPDGKMFQVIKQPEKTAVAIRHIRSMIRMFVGSFQKDTFPRKMAREI